MRRAAVTAVFFALFPAALCGQDAYQSELAGAELAVEEQRWSDAERAYMRVFLAEAKFSPKDRRAGFHHHRLADVYLDMKNPTAAIRILDAGIKVRSAAVKADLILAHLYDMRGYVSLLPPVATETDDPAAPFKLKFVAGNDGKKTIATESLEALLRAVFTNSAVSHVGQHQDRFSECGNAEGDWCTASGSHIWAEEGSLRKGLHIREKLLGENHPLVARSLTNLGRAYAAHHRFDAAEPRFRRALDIYQRMLEPPMDEYRAAADGLASIVWQKAKFTEAEALRSRTRNR